MSSKWAVLHRKIIMHVVTVDNLYFGVNIYMTSECTLHPSESINKALIDSEIVCFGQWSISKCDTKT